jgi:hypothetical protein
VIITQNTQIPTEYVPYALTIYTRYVGPTNTRGAKIMAYEKSGRGKKMMFDYDYAASDRHQTAAIEYLRKRIMEKDEQWRLIAHSDNPSGTGCAFLFLFIGTTAAAVEE